MTTRRAAALVGSRIPALRTMGTVAFVAGWAALLVATTSLLVGASAPSPVGLAALALAFGLLSSAALFLILDALRVGFGSLDAFFQEALARSARRTAQTPTPSPAPEPARAQAEQRGFIGDRPFTLYGDGTVAVETLLGVRVFASLADAQDFIGA